MPDLSDSTAVVLKGWNGFALWRGHLALSRDLFSLSPLWVGDTADIQGVEGREADNHSARHRTAPETKTYPAQNINSAKAEKPAPR